MIHPFHDTPLPPEEAELHLIAQDILHITTLRTRGNPFHDIQDVRVDKLLLALRAARDAGARNRREGF